MLDDPFVLVAPAGSPRRRRRVGHASSESPRSPLIGYRNAGVQPVVDQLFRPGDDPPTFVFRSDDNPTIQGCVASGIGYWATPLLTVDTDDPAVAIVPIVPAPEPAAHRPGLAGHPALVARRSTEFVDVAEEVCREVEQRLADVLGRSQPRRGAAPRRPRADACAPSSHARRDEGVRPHRRTPSRQCTHAWLGADSVAGRRNRGTVDQLPAPASGASPCSAEGRPTTAARSPSAPWPWAS